MDESLSKGGAGQGRSLGFSSYDNTAFFQLKCTSGPRDAPISLGQRFQGFNLVCTLESGEFSIGPRPWRSGFRGNEAGLVNSVFTSAPGAAVLTALGETLI